jgi:hypothetical protein
MNSNSTLSKRELMSMLRFGPSANTPNRLILSCVVGRIPSPLRGLPPTILPKCGPYQSASRIPKPQEFGR